ncbi:hypothetical protein BgiBS90_010691 [Biomphalaria glabrata]|nr:hypothetical protein BgiBS90_010691 [Biomphalaria glabrata]
MISRAKTSRRQNGSRQNVPSPKRRGQNGVAKTAAPKRHVPITNISPITPFRRIKSCTGLSVSFRACTGFNSSGLTSHTWAHCVGLDHRPRSRRQSSQLYLTVLRTEPS